MLELARRDAFVPLWSGRILDEVSRAIVKVTDTPLERARVRGQRMDEAFPDARVENWESLVDSIRGVPDSDDRHVIAAAIEGNASVIVTDNLRDFPDSALEQHSLHAVSSDEFLLDVLDLNQVRVVKALEAMVEKRRRPPVTMDELLYRLERSMAPRFADEMRGIVDEL
nr:PIN domain-containing protein [Corynebacterium halotolerans]